MRRVVASPLLLVLALAGCAGPPPRGAGPPRPAQAKPSKDELRQLQALAAGVVVGKVESYDDLPGGRVYRVRVDEVLSLKPASERQAETHPLAAEETFKLTTFLYRDAVAREIGPLEELARYVFFLAPSDDAGEWLNLEDPARHQLPEAQATVDALRALRDQPLGPGGPGRPPG